jgi:hypothetical protein
MAGICRGTSTSTMSPCSEARELGQQGETTLPAASPASALDTGTSQSPCAASVHRAADNDGPTDQPGESPRRQMAPRPTRHRLLLAVEPLRDRSPRSLQPGQASIVVRPLSQIVDAKASSIQHAGDRPRSCEEQIPLPAPQSLSHRRRERYDRRAASCPPRQPVALRMGDRIGADLTAIASDAPIESRQAAKIDSYLRSMQLSCFLS